MTQMHSSIWPSSREWWQALRWVALTFTVVIAITLSGSFINYETVVSSGHPWLPKIHCPGCLFCGMTRSFCAMSALRWQEAFRWNHGGPALYLGGWLWLALTVVVAARMRRRSNSSLFRWSRYGNTDDK
ncbi:MAG: hypothetical protein ABI977_24550 [Acidobacteriota bacterium]